MTTASPQPAVASRISGAETSAIVGFREITAALAEERPLDDVLHLVVTRLSALTGADRCSMHLRDDETGLFHGTVAHAAYDIDAEVRALVSGGPGDAFTQEVVRTRRPVLVTDSLVDPRTVHSAMRKWRARSVMGVPMILRDEVIGLLCLDNEDAVAGFTEEAQELALVFAELAATAVNQVQLTERLRASVRAQADQLSLLQQATRMEGQLTEILLRGWGVRPLAETVARLLGKPCWIYDDAFRCLAQGSPQGAGPARTLDPELRRAPSIAEVLDALEPGRPRVLGPLPPMGLKHRLLVARVAHEERSWGYVVVAEVPGPLGVLDEAIVRRAALNIAHERVRSRREGDIEWHAVEAFTSSLLRGEQVALDTRAQALGVDLHAPRVVCLVGRPQGPMPEALTPQALSRRLTDEDSPSAALATPSGNDVALLLELPRGLAEGEAVQWVRERVERVLAGLADHGSLFVAVSTLVREPGEDAGAHTQARQVLTAMRTHLTAEGSVVLAAGDLGAGRLLLSTADQDEVQRFARDALGPLLSTRSPKHDELLCTLNAFLQSGRVVREAAEALGVHPNTVRYRIGGIEKLTGLAVSTDDDAYLTAQMAVLVLRLSGRLPLVGLAG